MDELLAHAIRTEHRVSLEEASHLLAAQRSAKPGVVERLAKVLHLTGRRPTPSATTPPGPVATQIR